jgi:hypothetical protein
VRVVGFRRMTGGIIATVHRLRVERVPSGLREFVVLRQYEHHGEVERESGILRQVADADVGASHARCGCGGHRGRQSSIS